MAVLQDSIVIERPRGQVWPFLIEPEWQPRWQSGLAEYVQLDPGPPAVGTRYRGVHRILGRRIDWTSEIVALRDGSSLQGRSIDSPLPFTVELTCTDVSAGTLVGYRLDSSGVGRFFGGVAEPVVTTVYGRQLRAGLERLRELVEATPA